jgi:hypothetical protein
MLGGDRKWTLLQLSVEAEVLVERILGAGGRDAGLVGGLCIYS